MFSTLSASCYVTPTQFLLSLATPTLLYGIYKIYAFVHNEMTSPLRDVPGPPSPSLIYGNLRQLSSSNGSVLHEDWINRYGTTIQFKGLLGVPRLLTTDLKAINYILFNSYDYPKPKEISYIVRQLLGNGILSAEGDVHKHQRKILNPAFGPREIRELTEIFVERALELRDLWSAEIIKRGGVGPIECFSWMSRAALDVIGIAGFNYKFNALSGDPDKNELMKSFSTLFKAGQKPSIIPILKAIYPPLRFLPEPNDIEKNKATVVMGRIGASLVNQSKASQGDKSSRRKDILSLLIQANTRKDLHEAERLSDEDVIAQIPTVIVAGHETTSIAMAWLLYDLTQNKDVQVKLREELSNVSTDNPTMDDLNGLPYLDAVVRETLRIHPPVSSVLRVANKDDCIPLNKPFTDRKGMVRDEIRVRKGQWITLPIILINQDQSIWGEDSAEFKPERWVNVPDAAASIPGVWGNMMTFLGGPRACMGYRFSLVEMKALVFTLVRAFEFDLAVPGKDIGTKPIGFQRPVLLTDPKNSNQMPLLVRPVSSNY